MKLITKAIERKLEKNPLYSGESKDMASRPILVKFFPPWGSWSWYVLEGDKQEDGDWLFFGYVEGFENEYGYFSFNELKSVTGPFGLKIERDMYFDNKTMADVDKGLARAA